MNISESGHGSQDTLIWRLSNEGAAPRRGEVEPEKATKCDENWSIRGMAGHENGISSET